MEENSNQFEPQATAPDGSKNTVRKVVKIVIIAVVAILLIVLLVNLLNRSPKEVTKSFYKKFVTADIEDAFSKYFDYTGYAVIRAYLYDGNSVDDLDDYDDFWDDYKDAKDDSDYEDYVEELEESLGDNLDDYYDDYMEDLLEDNTISVKKIKDVEKISSHFYKVKLVLEVEDEDGDEKSSTVNVYVMKKGLKSYIVYFESTNDLPAVGNLIYSSSLYKDVYSSYYDYFDDYDW